MIWALMPLEFRRVINLTSKPASVFPKSACSTRFKVCAWAAPRDTKATKDTIPSRQKETRIRGFIAHWAFVRQRKSFVLLEAGLCEIDLINRAFVAHRIKIARLIFAERNEPLRNHANLARCFQSAVFLRQPENAFGHVVATDVNSIE